MSSRPPPLSLYVHIPWCARKCPYCDFNSHRRAAVPEEALYVSALLQDLGQDLVRVPNRPLETIFIGGGTPSLFSTTSIAALLQGIRARSDCHAQLEVTLEANPGSAEADRFAGYREAGINRLSIGVQSFHDGSLRSLERIHDAGEAAAAVKWAREAGFDNINIDLMFGLPQQDLEAALEDVATAIELAPEHISFYQLTLEPNTRFHRSPPALPEADCIWEMQRQGQRMLAAHGYAQYEISAYARPGRRCRHNLNYWTFGDYLGIGAGAHGKLTDNRKHRLLRLWKARHPSDYLARRCSGNFLSGCRELDVPERILEFMMNTLRLNQGFAPALFEARTQRPLRDVWPVLRLAAERGLLDLDQTRVRPTALGRRYLDGLLLYFMEPR